MSPAGSCSARVVDVPPLDCRLTIRRRSCGRPRVIAAALAPLTTHGDRAVRPAIALPLLPSLCLPSPHPPESPGVDGPAAPRVPGSAGGGGFLDAYHPSPPDSPRPTGIPAKLTHAAEGNLVERVSVNRRFC